MLLCLWPTEYLFSRDYEALLCCLKPTDDSPFPLSRLASLSCDERFSEYMLLVPPHKG